MHNTGNPLGSKDILDLYDNSENIDYFANSQLDEHPDRFGAKRLTLAGLIKRSMALRNEINDFSGALTFRPEWSDVPMNVSQGVGGEGGALNLQAEALGNRLELLKSNIDDLFSNSVNLGNKLYGINGSNTDIIGLKKAIEDANTKGLNITAPKNLVIKLVGSETITFSCSCDFNHCKLDLSEFSGKIYFTDGVEWITYNSSHPVVSSLNSAGELSGSVISSWNNIPEVENSFVRFITNQDFYSYRQNVVKRTEMNCHTRYGQLDSSFTYPMNGGDITAVEVKKFNPYFTVVKNLNIFLGSNDLTDIFISVSGCLVNFENLVFTQNNFKNLTKNQTWFSIMSSAYITLKNIRFVWASHSGATTGYTYNISMRDSYNVSFDDVKGSGDGWGATGSNLCRIVKINNSNLSRVDFHQPFSELLHISNSKIGSWGVLVTAIGTLLIENTEFNITNNININNHGFIRTRDDTGGFCDGDLKIRNCSFNDFASNVIKSICKHQYSNNPKPSNTPIVYRFWRTIEISNVSCLKRLNLAPELTANTEISYPVKMVVDNCIKGDFEFVSRDFKEYYPTVGKSNPSNTPISNPPNFSLSINNVNLRHIFMVEGPETNRFNFHVCLTNLFNTEKNPGCSVELLVEGIFNIYGSMLEGLDFYSGRETNKKLYVSLVNSVLRHTGQWNPNDPLNGFNNFISVSISNCLISGASQGALVKISKAALTNCTFIIADVLQNGLPIGSLGTASGWSGPVEMTIPEMFNRRNILSLVTGFDSDFTRKQHEFTLPRPGCSTVIEFLPGKHLTLTTSTDGTKITISSTEYNTNVSTPRSVLLYS